MYFPYQGLGNRPDFWLEISTLEQGEAVRVPLTLYARAQEVIARFPTLCGGVTLIKRNSGWHLSCRKGWQEAKG